MEIKIEQTIKLKFGDTEVSISKEDAEKLYDNVADLLGYKEDEIKYIYVPWDTTPYLTPQRLTAPWTSPFWEPPYYSTSGYIYIDGEQLNTNPVTRTTSITDKT